MTDITHLYQSTTTTRCGLTEEQVAERGDRFVMLGAPTVSATCGTCNPRSVCEHQSTPPVTFSVGDRVTVTRNDYSIEFGMVEHNLRLGSSAEVLSIEGDDIMVAGVSDASQHIFQEVRPHHITKKGE